ncbi:MAG: hypothetical protein EVJ48_02940 [Candidatus Acidulodesulfobacterium acidiphilum]|uniref:Zinc finger CHC2-type domain-containing protein n=1 Tax=Candidatus Acidulodesulfobacterium acidiphilum TaxID=2597224 RepID=A0A520XFN7_9DELT|nr:MAG: hypothetical protein EVJ48_02940 [Candidatus Acidulodesulfobacterium acidiphilum]
MAYIDIAEKYLEFKKIGKNYFALCPFHDEKTRSFQLNPENGLWRCHGCNSSGNIFQLIEKMESVNFPESVEIAKNYGIDPPAGFKERPQKNIQKKERSEGLKQEYIQGANEADKRLLTETEKKEGSNSTEKRRLMPKKNEKKTAIYTYDNEKGEIVFEKEKWESFSENGVRTGKRFIVYHFEGAKRIIGIGDNKQILYKINEITAKDISTIGICEGEKDVDNLYKSVHIPNTAWTTNSAGALHWDERFNKYFLGKNVLIFEDNDDAGRNRTEKIKAELTPVAKNIKVITFSELEPHGDVSDYLEINGCERLIEKITGSDSREETNQKQEIPPETSKKTELKNIDLLGLRFLKDRREYVFKEIIPLKKGEANIILNSNIEFLCYAALLLSNGFRTVFLTEFKEEDVMLYLKNIYTRMKNKPHNNFKIGSPNSEIPEDTEMIVSTEYMELSGITSVCPPHKERKYIPDYIFKNNELYDKFGRRVLTVRNLKGTGAITSEPANFNVDANKEVKFLFLNKIFKKSFKRRNG